MTNTVVVLVNYKGAIDTWSCIQSLSKCNIPPEIIVVDNTPNDPDLNDVLARYPEVKLIKAPDNLGFGRGNNLAIDWILKHTEHKYIFVLNNDTTIKPDAIEQMEEVMQSDSKVGIVSARIVFAEDENKLWYGGGEVDWKRGGGKVPGVLGSADAALALKARYVTFASGCAMMIRREILQQYGGFDERYFMYEEDLELSLRVQENGWKIWYAPSAVIKHIGQGSLRKDGEKFIGVLWPNNPNLPFYVFNIIKNRLTNMNIYAHGWNRVMFVFLFPVLLLKLFIKYVISNRWDGVVALIQACKAFWIQRGNT